MRSRGVAHGTKRPLKLTVRSRSIMRALITGLLIIAPPAIAADFRGTPLGGSCAGIEVLEDALGSQKGWSDPGVKAFRGRAFDRDVTIIYLCEKDTLAVGDYLFPMQEYDVAVADFTAAYANFSSAYGAPSNVFPSDSAPFPSVGASAPKEYGASWVTDELHVHVRLIPAGDGSRHNWHVMVAVQRNPARSNQRSERP
jgi:hypothetical protein